MKTEPSWHSAPKSATHLLCNGVKLEFARLDDNGFYYGTEDPECRFNMDRWKAVCARPAVDEKCFDTKPIGMKHDQDKPMYNLLPANAIHAMAEVMTFGANKYAPNSWQAVEDGLERYRAALLRHTFAIQRGELVDSESGLNHSAHILCCAAFINELERGLK